MNETARRCVGGLVGVAAGTVAYCVLLQYDVHILAAVGAGGALGVSAAARTKSTVWGVVTAVVVVLASLLVEFWCRPFRADPSFAYFVAHLTELPRNSLVSLAVVAALGFWFGRGRTPAPR